MAPVLKLSDRKAQLAWLVMAPLTGVAGWLGGAPLPAMIAAAVLLCVPVMMAHLPTATARQRTGLGIVAWTILAVFAVAVSGGPRSPLALLFLIAPLYGLAAGRRQAALEAAAFSVLAYLGLALLNGFVPAPQPPPGWLVFTSAVTLACLILAGLFILVALEAQRQRAWREAGLKADEPVGKSPSAEKTISLPDRSGVALVSISPLGRIRAVAGDTRLLGRLSPGQEAGRALAALDPSLGEAFHESAQMRRIDGAGGAIVASSHLGETGYSVVLRAVEGERQAADLETLFAEKLAERTTFFASLGHDLKTPLNAIIGFSDLMRNQLRGPLPEAYRDYCEIIQESGQDLLLLIDDMLDLAKADANRLVLDLEPVDLAASGASVLRQLGVQAERAGVTLRLTGEDEAWAHADARAVRQIWQNLVSNAIKYSDRGGQVTLSALARGESVLLCVEDQGAGMDSEDLRRLAEPFAQGRNSTGRPGTGLGLAVVKQFADLHGGQVKIDTAPGEGTRVEVSFPPADPAHLEDFGKAAQ